jgi:hypothetical protein
MKEREEHPSGNLKDDFKVYVCFGLQLYDDLLLEYKLKQEIKDEDEDERFKIKIFIFDPRHLSSFLKDDFKVYVCFGL